MNAKQENKLSMYLLVQKIANENTMKWNGLTAFGNAFDDFESKIAAIKVALEVQKASVTGVTKDKARLRDVMVTTGLRISRAVIAYAENENNRTLQEKVSFTPSYLKLERDTVLAQVCQLIKDEATIVLANLTDYGIEQADLDLLQETINEYNTAIPTPRQAIRNRVDATNNLAQLIADADTILAKKLDMLLDSFKEDEFVFYNAFKGARRVINSGKRDTRLEGVLKDKLTQAVIADALIELRNSDNFVVDVAETNNEGVFVFEHLPAGKLTVTIDKDGYELQGIEKADIRKGVINKLNLGVDRVE